MPATPSEIQVAVLNVKLKHLDAWATCRQHNAACYDAAFARAKLGAAVQTLQAIPAPVRRFVDWFVEYYGYKR